MKKLLLLLVVVAVLAIYGKRWLHGDTSLSLVSAKAVNPYPASSPLYPATQQFVDGVNGDSKLKSRFAGVFTRRGLYSEVNTAMRRGAKSLDGPVLAGALTAMARTVPRLDTHTCAEVFREHDTFDAERSRKLGEAMERIPVRHYANLMRFYLQALQAEANDAPVRPVDQEELKIALGHLSQRFQGDFAQRFMTTMGDRQSASDEDVCWAGSTLLFNISEMGDHDRELLARWGIAGG